MGLAAPECSVRMRLADKIRRCDLQALERIGDTDIHARISRDTGMISQVARPLFAAAQAAVMVVFTMIYIAAVSPVAAAMCAALILDGALFYLKDRNAYETGLKDSSRWEDELIRLAERVAQGFQRNPH
ncbi:MAG TPA: hypothetical protein VK558_10820 [Patescibacteria group bacterium]|nr:hypothetical protein [Patescibacteria group bacterium]